MTLRIRFVLLFLFLGFCNQHIQAQYKRDSVFVGGETRYFNIYLPKHYSSYSAIPLVMAFHGAGGTGWTSIKYHSKLSKKADIEHFILVYPEGKRFQTSTYCGWNAGDCCDPSSTNNVDDVGFVNILLDTLLSRYEIDDTRIYAVGSSNGAMFSLRLACELSERIAAVAVNAGTETFSDCHPWRPVSIINFHSVLDSTVVYNGGLGNESPIYNVYFVSQDSMMYAWKNINKCHAIDTIVYGGDSAYTLIRISNCACNYAKMDFYTTSDGGHSWPGGGYSGRPVSQELIATDVLWDFFKEHVINCQQPQWPNIAAINNLNAEGSLKIYPNPVTDGKFQLFTNDSQLRADLTIYTLQGKVIHAQKTESHLTTVTLDAPPGIYLLQLKLNEAVFFGKIVVE
ncbi:MAG: T9SS type A sorting domain-containing protein [Bacteroidota bacterium]